MVLATAFFEFVLALHIMAVVVAFGWTFALPIMFAVASRHDPRSIPTLHRIEVRVSRVLLNPALVVVLGAGIYLASKLHVWSDFFVQWGLAAVLVIGAAVGAVMIPASKRAAELAARDLAAHGEGPFEPSQEYRDVAQRINMVGSILSLLVLLTILFMALQTS